MIEQTLFKQIKPCCGVNEEEEDHVIISFPSQTWKFRVKYGDIVVDHSSQAVIASAAFTGKTRNSKCTLYKGKKIKANNDVFKWLKIEPKVEYVIHERRIEDGTVISFFS